ncbi:hypothetical protein ACIRU8_27170 [Streptomyces sp. NPDC101175]|uniref:hypothetical protein n=1 Tax=Streptomyces sp. NPDC101175 TaxID=3366123 RepID=UPI003837AF0A
MSLWNKAKRARGIGGVIVAMAGAGHAPPPADLPAYLQRQYGEYSKTRDRELGRDIKRLTTRTRQPTTALDRSAARKLRGTT